MKRLEGWKRAVAGGHEIANHSVSHPCTGNFPWSFHNALENYTLEQMSQQLDEANADIQRLLGVHMVTFAYPCGQKFVGRGHQMQSYVPLIAEKFLVGRGYLDEYFNDPAFCDLAQAGGTAFDDMDYIQMVKRISQAACDFFVAVTTCLRIMYLLVIVGVGTRRIVHLNVTRPIPRPTGRSTAKTRPDLCMQRRSVIYDRLAGNRKRQSQLRIIARCP